MKTSQTFRRALAGTILCSVAFAGTVYAADDVQPKKEEAKQLENIEVTAPRLRKEVTEGSKSYTSPAVTVASKTPVALKDIPNSVSVITRQQIEDQNFVTVGDALNQATGVNVFSNDTTQSQYYSRGFALESQNDGTPSAIQFSGYQQFDLDIYDRIEVFRGPAGLLQGSGAPAGTVNLVRKRARDTFGVSGYLSAGTWNNYRASVDVTGPLTANKALRGRAVLTGQDRDFYFDRAHARKWLGYGVLEYDITPRTTISTSLTYQDSKDPSFTGPPAWTNGGYTNAPRNMNPFPDWGRYLWTSQEITAKVEHTFENKWVATARFSKKDQNFFFKDAYPTTGVDPATLTATYARREYDYDYEQYLGDVYASGPFKLLGRSHNLLVGFNYGSWETTGKGARLSPDLTGVNVFNQGSNITTEPTIPYTTGSNSKTVQKGYYSQLRFKILDPLTLVVGGRFTDYDNKSRSVPPSASTNWKQGAKADTEFTLQGGLVYDVTKNITAYFSYSDIFVPQSNLKFTGEAIDPRTGRQYEIGTKGEFFDKQLNANIAAFLIRDQNRALNDPDHPTFSVNGGEYESKGLEGEIAGSPLPGWDLSAGYTYLLTEILRASSGQGQAISYWYPKHSFKLWSKYSFSGGILDGLSAGGGIRAYSKSETSTLPTVAVPNLRIQDAYAVVDLLVGYQFNKNLSGTLNVNNLLDEEYRTRIGGLNTYNTYGDPRSITVTLRSNF